MSNTTMKSRWTSFVASPVRGRVSRGLEEESNPRHRARVEHNRKTILIHLSDEDGVGWTVWRLIEDARVGCGPGRNANGCR